MALRLARRFGLDSAEDTREMRSDPPRAKALVLRHSRSVAIPANDGQPLPYGSRTERVRREQLATAQRFDRLCAAMAITNGMLARRLRVSEKIIRDYRSGLRRIPSDLWHLVGHRLAIAFLTGELAHLRGEV